MDERFQRWLRSAGGNGNPQPSSSAYLVWIGPGPRDIFLGSCCVCCVDGLISPCSLGFSQRVHSCEICYGNYGYDQRKMSQGTPTLPHPKRANRGHGLQGGSLTRRVHSVPRVLLHDTKSCTFAGFWWPDAIARHWKISSRCSIETQGVSSQQARRSNQFRGDLVVGEQRIALLVCAKGVCHYARPRSLAARWRCEWHCHR